MPPLHSSNETIDFLVEDSHTPVLKMWWSGMTGNVEVKLINDHNQSLLYDKGIQERKTQILELEEGSYRLDVRQNNFTGGIALGFDDLILKTNLNEENYMLIESTPKSGFYWDYILYIPNQVKHSKLLVVPNNTGYATDNYELHKERAKGLIQYKSKLADELGVLLLVPIFPRPLSYSGLYTHALDRACLQTDVSNLKRLDLQLIEMINDCKSILTKENIILDDKILMSGFSASGDFVDRFSFLHPQCVDAVAYGGASTMIPLKDIRGTALPYPLGVSDYSLIANEDFNTQAAMQIERYIYKGAQDEGGWQTITENGASKKYTWREYYEKYLLKELEELASNDQTTSYSNSILSDTDLDLIAYKAFEGHILLERFMDIESIYKDMNFTKATFKVYEGIGHTTTDEMKKDELDFFRRVLANQ